jgi:cobyrinic acid a,c-diamide synthase
MTASYVHFYFPSNPTAVAALFAPDRAETPSTVGGGLPPIGP